MNSLILKLYYLLGALAHTSTCSDVRDAKFINILGNALSPQTAIENFVLSTYQVLEGPLNFTRCITTGGQVGMCIGSVLECTKMGGTVKGICSTLAKCCVVESGCDGETYINNTYFVGPSTLGMSSGVCTYTVHRQKEQEICQLRLDFELLVLAPPVSGERFDESRDGSCLVDIFEVSGSTNKLTMLCGTNTGKHMYIHVPRHHRNTVRLTIKSTDSFSPRNWRIRVTQIACNADYKAPEDCTEYYTGITGTLTSPNYVRGRADNQELNNAFQRMCIRREFGFCGICYTQCAPQDRTTFSLTRLNTLSINDCPNDYLHIPCGQTSYEPFTSIISCDQLSYCGQTNFKTICSPYAPFEVLYRTNAVEASNENSQGFCMNYRQQTCQGRKVKAVN